MVVFKAFAVILLVASIGDLQKLECKKSNNLTQAVVFIAFMVATSIFLIFY